MSALFPGPAPEREGPIIHDCGRPALAPGLHLAHPSTKAIISFVAPLDEEYLDCLRWHSLCLAGQLEVLDILHIEFAGTRLVVRVDVRH